jgi:hypothetical protein
MGSRRLKARGTRAGEARPPSPRHSAFPCQLQPTRHFRVLGLRPQLPLKLQPTRHASIVATLVSSRPARILSSRYRRLNQHFGTTVVRSGAPQGEEGLPSYVAFRALWRAYFDGGWTPLKVDLDLLFQLAWHALRERYYHDGLHDCDELRQRPAYDTQGGHWRRCSGWLLQAASCALDPLWLAHNAPDADGIAAVCVGTALLDCQARTHFLFPPHNPAPSLPSSPARSRAASAFLHCQLLLHFS